MHIKLTRFLIDKYMRATNAFVETRYSIDRTCTQTIQRSFQTTFDYGDCSEAQVRATYVTLARIHIHNRMTDGDHVKIHHNQRNVLKQTR